MPVARRAAVGSGRGRPAARPAAAARRPPAPAAAAEARRRAAAPRRGFRLARCSCCCCWLVFLVAVPFFAWTKVDKVDAEPERRPPRRPARHDVPHGRQRLARRPERRGAQGARHRRRRRPAHRHDHAAAHRLRPEPADVDPARLPRRHPRPRHHQDQRRLRVRRAASCWSAPSRRTPASGSTTTSRSASAASSTSSTRSAASRSARSSDMKDKLANLDIKKGCQEADGKTALGYARSRHTSSARRHRPRRSTSARWSPRSATRRLAVDGRSTRCATGGSTTPRPARSASTRT